MKKEEVEAEYVRVYKPLVKKFCDEVSAIADQYQPEKGKNLAPAPFLPIIGNGYYDAQIRVAIYGMETYCWHDLYRFVKKFDKDNTQSLAEVKAYTDGIEGDNGTYKKRFQNHHGVMYENKSSYGFWKFVYSALACIYGITDDKIRNKQELLRSFIWGNVNAYEKYEASWKKKVKYSPNKKTDWQKVFDASQCFNSAQLLFPYTKPHIVVVFYRGMTRKWLTGKEGKWEENELRKIDWSDFFVNNPKLTDEQQKTLKKYIRCYYLSDTHTVVFKLMHPQGMLHHGKGIKVAIWKAAINYAIQKIMKDNNISSAH
ncbi:MAG: hypothetical protein MJ003_06380 [Paludibacteraceae bacterium]|nr:hypothetical protein [Paludibacteraceae bacterium]